MNKELQELKELIGEIDNFREARKRAIVYKIKLNISDTAPAAGTYEELTIAKTLLNKLLAIDETAFIPQIQEIIENKIYKLKLIIKTLE